MLNLIALIVFLCSLVGLGFIIYKKIPTLNSLPKEAYNKINWKNIFLKLKNSSFLKNFYFNFNIFLQKLLSKIKVLTLKIENKVSQWLQELRKRSQKNKK